MRKLTLGAVVLSAALILSACGQSEVVNDDTSTPSQQEILDEATGNYEEPAELTFNEVWNPEPASGEKSARYAELNNGPEDELTAHIDRAFAAQSN